MNLPMSLGFPRMLVEDGEKRIFMPKFVQQILDLGISVCIENGYGEDCNLDFEDFRQGNSNVKECSRSEVFNKDVVLILRSPDDDFWRIRPGAILLSMLHFPTQPDRVKHLSNLNVNAIALDLIKNDQGVRLVENMKAVAFNGLNVAISLLEKRRNRDSQKNYLPIHVLILGSGMVGKQAVDAAVHLGDFSKNYDYISNNKPGVICSVIGRNLTKHSEYMISLLKETDVLVDATQRRNSSSPVIPNHWIQYLPNHAIVVDLSVDPYLMDSDPPVVRGIEGIPKGTLNKYIFEPDDPDWIKTIPPEVPCVHRRTTVSCFSWPGLNPKECMDLYGEQLRPILSVIFKRGYENLSSEGDYFERAICRATLKSWVSS